MVSRNFAPARPATILVVDAGPLIALAIAQLLPSTLAHFGKLTIPQAVVQECTSNQSEPGAIVIRDLVQTQAVQVVPESDIIGLDPAYSLGLGSGEQAVLAYAFANQHIALVDDERARRTALRLGIVTVRSGAILLALKKAGQIQSIKPALEIWQNHGYFLSESVLYSLLSKANEI